MMRIGRDERGSITPFVVIVSLAIIMLAALVIDGGRQLNGKGRAIAYAQEAARAGAQAVDVADPELNLVPRLALQAARDYCELARSADDQLTLCRPGLTTINDPAGAFTAVTVTVRVESDAILLGIIGRSVLRSTGTALARPVSGISGPDSGKVSTLGPPSLAPPGEGQPPATLPPEPDETIEPCIPRDEAEDEEEEEDEDPPEDPPGDDEDDEDEDLEVCPEPEPDAE
ncbi:TadE/TadG family type IV pilus assembly protein [Aeromicrobium sp. CF4.19]|uniref:TadE/TadG family type IV pilus assembly protein n=1 Tax=Aeromicrobium sp. CF4.19 TaxID=3373082 RepID=UPI003EE55870